MNRVSRFFRTTTCFVGLLAVIGGSEAALAQGLDSHVHGAAELNVALVDRQLQVEFISPAMNLLGFEHAPNSQEEADLLADVTVKLLTADWLLGDAMAHCEVTDSSVVAPAFAEVSQQHEHQEHAHEHTTHAHEANNDSHADFRVDYLFQCPAAPATEFRIYAFDHFSGIQDITVQWITTNQQGLVELTTSNPTLILE